MARIVFYCHDSKEHIRLFEYYQQDIETLQALGHEVIICSLYREIPFQFDAMFIWWWSFALWPVLLCKLLGRPSLITGVFNFRYAGNLQSGDYFHRPLWQRLLLRAATLLTDRNLFIDESEFRNCTEYFRLTSARLYPCSIGNDYLNGPGPARELALFNLAWSGRGNLVRKGIPELLDALHILKGRGHTVRAFLAGPPGDGTEWLLSRIRELGIEDQVTYLGELARDRKIELLRKYEVYAQPSHFEGFGLATAEAMGSGACVITCDVGAVRSVVGDCGIYVPPGAPEALADGIERALSDAELRSRLQREAHERARTVFAPENKKRLLQSYLAEVGIA